MKKLQNSENRVLRIFITFWKLKILKSPMSLAHLELVMQYLSLHFKHQTYSEHLAIFFH